MAKNTHSENTNFLRLLGARIKELRVMAGYSSYETFAIEHDIDRKQYWRAENGSNLTIATLRKIAKFHKMTLEELFKGID